MGHQRDVARVLNGSPSVLRRAKPRRESRSPAPWASADPDPPAPGRPSARELHPAVLQPPGPQLPHRTPMLNARPPRKAEDPRAWRPARTAGISNGGCGTPPFGLRHGRDQQPALLAQRLEARVGGGRKASSAAARVPAPGRAAGRLRRSRTGLSPRTHVDRLARADIGREQVGPARTISIPSTLPHDHSQDASPAGPGSGGPAVLDQCDPVTTRRPMVSAPSPPPVPPKVRPAPRWSQFTTVKARPSREKPCTPAAHGRARGPRAAPPARGSKSRARGPSPIARYRPGSIQIFSSIPSSR